jgi:tRNA A37 threonylcarbamoyltransferase TsaD
MKKLFYYIGYMFGSFGAYADRIFDAMDNGAMIAVAGYYHAQKKQFTSWEKITVDPNWKVDQPRTTQHP